MAYANIVFIKLEKRLLNDPRWWTMAENSQLIYIKLLLLAGETYNRMPLDENVLRLAVRSSLGQKQFITCLEEINKNFPKLKNGKCFRYFEEFNTKTNWVDPKQLLRHRRAIQKTATEEEKEEEKKKRGFFCPICKTEVNNKEKLTHNSKHVRDGELASV